MYPVRTPLAGAHDGAAAAALAGGSAPGPRSQAAAKSATRSRMASLKLRAFENAMRLRDSVSDECVQGAPLENLACLDF